MPTLIFRPERADTGATKGSTLCSKIELTDIDLRALTPVKVTLAHYGAQDHCRWIFRNVRNDDESLFVKIWNPGYVRRDNIVAAIDSGFYDDRLVPALYGVIFHKDICRGYVMHAGRVNLGEPGESFRDFVFFRTRQTGFYNVQFGRCHTMIYRDQSSLLDLEGVYPIEEYLRLPQYHCRFADSAYEGHVAELYKQQCADGSPMYDPPFVASPILSPTLMARLSRTLGRRVRNIVPRLDLIQY